MARIRTIKPTFWTDKNIVQLPLAARLLYIGLWNLADDEGWVEDEPESIQMQLFPRDDINVDALLGLLALAERITEYESPDGSHGYLRIERFTDHQRISHPTPSRVTPMKPKRKRRVPDGVRRQVAERYGCAPLQTIPAECFYCDAPGQIAWLTNAWVVFPGLELDHVIPENSGGLPRSDNLILACRRCSRAKGHQDAHTFILTNFPERSGELTKRLETLTNQSNFIGPEPDDPPPSDAPIPENSGALRSEGEGNGKGERRTSSLRSDVVEQRLDVHDVWQAYAGYHPKAVLTDQRRRYIQSRLKLFPAERLIAAIHGNHRDPWCCGENAERREYHDLKLILRDADKIERYAAAPVHLVSRVAAGGSRRYGRGLTTAEMIAKAREEEDREADRGEGRDRALVRVLPEARAGG